MMLTCTGDNPEDCVKIATDNGREGWLLLLRITSKLVLL